MKTAHSKKDSTLQQGKVMLVNPVIDLAETEEIIKCSYPADSIHIDSVSTIEDAQTQLKEATYHYVVLDIAVANDHSAKEVVSSMQRLAPDAPLLVLTHQQNAADALSLIQAGAQDYMIKGRGDSATLRRIFQYSLERSRFQRELLEVNNQLESRIQERTAELEQALKLAQELNREKTLLFSNLTHELRTPLHAILNFSDFAREKYGKAPDEKILGYIDRIHRSGKRLLDLVDDILDFSKLKAEGREKHFEPVDLSLLVEEVTHDIQSLADKRELTIRILKKFDHATISCNPNKITQVLVNLLSNAYKFTPEGSTVSIVIEENERKDCLRVSVQDQGPGIPEEDLKGVFDAFSQSQKVNSGAFVKGTGLGLAICKEIINHHHGKMWAENPVEGGAKLSFELPLQETRAQDENSDR